MTLTIIIIYLALVVFIGVISHRLFRGTGEDYFMATRTIGPFILLMSLFGTNMTAFSILGASGEAYHHGIGVFALMASSTAFIAPVVFFFIGMRAWAIGKRFGYLTQVDFFRERWNANFLGLLIFIVLILLVIPYLLIGIMGGGITLNQITDGQIPQWVGSLMVCVVVMIYVTYGGLRGTAWVNTMQTLVFMILGGVAFFVIINKLGGLGAVMAKVAEDNPGLLIRGKNISVLKMLSYTFIPLSVGMFPHIFMHWLSAKKAESFRMAIIWYPLCVALVWVPSVLLGITGTIDFPGLIGPAANSVLIKMIDLHAPEALAGFLAAGVLAAIMSSLDSQVLAVGTMFTNDIVKHYGFGDKMSEKQQILFGRIFVSLVLLITFLLSLIANRSIFKLGIWSFTGFASLLPIVIAALYWKRSTKSGALASVFSVILLWIYYFIQDSQAQGYTVGGTGIMPVVVIFFVSALALVVVSLFTSPPDSKTIQKFFPEEGETLKEVV